ncbi:MAG: leucine-rich repeat domain-containing protein [Clostridia bacterium]|nr:leucine-rich repeat domain-containing protein [Clostridia bacterium]
MKKSKRNLLTIVVLSMLIVTITIFVASCNRHEHSFNEAWTSDATGHYHDASCEHTELISNKAPHTFGEAEIVSQASCTENGLKKYTCTVCQYVKEETIPQTGHAYSSEYQKDEYGHWVIANCEHTTVVGEKKAHSFESSITREATCGENGVKTFVCSECDFSIDQEIPMLNHTYSEDWDSNEQGHWHSATCEHSNELSPRAPHSFDAGVTEVIGNCFKDGRVVYTCADCNYVLTEIIEKTAHTIGDDNRCSSCGHMEASANGLEFELNDERTGWTLTGVQASLSGTDLSIPSTYKDLPITAIGSNVFKSISLNSLTIPPTIKGIGKNAFKYSGSEKPIASVYYTGTLKDWVNINFNDYGSNPLYGTVVLYINNTPIRNLEIDSTIERIKDYAFYGCESLKKLTLGENLREIGTYAFYNCKSLTEIKFTPAQETLGKYSFGSCSSLEKINFSDNGSLKAIGQYAFASNKGLKEIVIPSTVELIDTRAFYNCTGLKNITIPKSVTAIGNDAFYSVAEIETTTYEGTLEEWLKIEFGEGESAPVCADKLVLGNEVLTELVVPASITNLPAGCFAGYRGLTKITIPSTCTKIGNEAFFGCTEVTTIVIEEGVTDIGSYSFAYCPLVTEVVIPNSMQRMNAGCFAYDIGLEKMTIPFGGYARNTSPEYSLFGYIFDEYGLGMGDYEANQQYDSTGGFLTYVLPESLKTIVYTGDTISDGEFSGCRFETVTFTGNIKEIPQLAFANCQYLKNVNMPDSVEKIGYFAFAGSFVLESITLPASLKTIEDKAFWYCKEIKEILIPASVEYIGAQAFESITALTKVTFENEDGWMCYEALDSETGISVDVSDLEANKTLLGETYSKYYWKRVAVTEE